MDQQELNSDQEQQKQPQEQEGEMGGYQGSEMSTLNPEDQPGFKRLFIANLPFSYKEEDVRDFLSKFGTVDKIYMVPNHQTGQFKGQVKVSFTGVDDVDKLIEDIKATKVNDTELRGEIAYTKEETNRMKQQYRERTRRQEMQRRAEYEDRYYRSSRGYNDYDRYRGYSSSSYYDRDPRRDDYRDYYSSRDDDRYRRRDDYPRRDYRDYRDDYPDRYSRRDDYPRDRY